MAGELQAGITVEWLQTDEEPFRPGATTEIFATLEPVAADNSTYYTPDWIDFYNTSILPSPVDYEALPKYQAEARELIINIETTGALPWESKLVVIGVLDPNALEPMAINFINDSELATIDEFLAFFEQSPYTTLVAYNVAFDYRFIYAVCQKYRKEARKWLQAELYDLMQQQEQVKNQFVPGFNKSGTLEEWSTYLFGSQPYAEQAQVFKWIKEGNTEEIVNFNSDKLAKCYGLWVLNKVVEGSIPGAEVLSRPTESTPATQEGQAASQTGNQEGLIPVQCPNCLQTQTMPKTAKVVNCVVCGDPIAHP